MESTNTFSRGLHTDTHELFQPEATYRAAVNFIRDVSGALRNEQGTASVTGLPAGLEIIGSTVLGTRIILFLCSTDNTQNEIGYFESTDNSYHTVINDPVLEFKITNQIDAIARINFQHQSIAYFVEAGNPPRKINIDVPPNPADYAEITKLIRNLSQPLISLTGVVPGGTVKSGGYQFAIRYVDASSNKTAFSKWTATIPVPGSNQKSAGRQKFIGGDLLNVSNKSIVLQIDDLDPLFPFIEIGVRYDNTSAQEVFKVAALVPINGSSVTYTFSQTPDETAEDIDNTEASVGFPDIAAAKCIEQKDNRAFISNITENADDDIWQIIANNIEVTYTIKEVDHFDDNNATSDRYADYKLENNSFEFKGYQRGEIYSLAVGGIYKSGNSSFAYHIPAKLGVGNNNLTGGDLRSNLTPERTWVAPTVTTPLTGELGTYVSIEAYPQGQDYPTDGIFKPGSPPLYLVRHHLMPSLEQQPSFGPTATPGASNKIRILGLKFQLNATAQALLDSMKDKIQGIVFYREPRGSEQNTSIFGQGLTKNLFQTVNTYTGADGNLDGLHVFKKEPFFGNYQLDQDMIHFGGAIGTKRTLAFYPVTDNAATTYPGPFNSTDFSKVDARRLAFFSPEVYLDIYKLGSFQPDTGGIEKLSLYATSLKPVLKIIGNVSTVNYLEASTQGSSVAGTRKMKEGSQIWLNADYKTSAPLLVGERASIGLDSNQSNLIQGGTEVESDIVGTHIDNISSADFLYLRLQDNIVKPASDSTNYWLSYNPGGNDFEQAPNTITATTDTKILYNLTGYKTGQYGSIGNKPYNTIKVFKDLTDVSLPFECYNGDTFVARYWFRDQELFQIRAIAVTYASSLVTTTNWTVPTNSYTPDGAGVGPGLSFKDSSYYYVESRVNPDYQHKDHGDFYQFQNDLYQLHSQLPYQESNNTSYNHTYTGDHEVTPQISRSGLFTAANVFETRTYYSQLSAQGELLDGYSEFRINDYYDLPKNTGEIIDTFVLENQLYMHTPQALWQSYVNPQTAQVNDIGEVFTGTGAIFSIPAKQIFTISGGYAGTTSHWAGCNTPFGRFFIDNRQGKAFMFNSNGVEEISNHGMFKDFLNLVQHTNDNPANGNGYTSVFDYKNKRWILSRSQGGSSMTISYSPELDSWTSFHSYFPTHSDSVGNRTFLFRKGTYALHELGLGARGCYFGDASQQSNLSIITTSGQGAGPADAKVFDNTELHTLSYGPAGGIQLFDTFNRISYSNEYQFTGTKTIISTNASYAEETLVPGEILSRMKKDHFQIAVSRETGSGDLGRMKSPWMRTDLSYDNTDNNQLIVSFIKTKFRLIAR